MLGGQRERLSSFCDLFFKQLLITMEKEGFKTCYLPESRASTNNSAVAHTFAKGQKSETNKILISFTAVPYFCR